MMFHMVYHQKPNKFENHSKKNDYSQEFRYGHGRIFFSFYFHEGECNKSNLRVLESWYFLFVSHIGYYSFKMTQPNNLT